METAFFFGIKRLGRGGITNPNLAPELKKECRCNSATLLG
jgi:hypothetical protein